MSTTLGEVGPVQPGRYWTDEDRPGWQPAPSGPELAMMSWLQDSFLARNAEEAALRLSQFGSWAPPAQPGYNPYTDADLAGYQDSLGMFREDQSPQETAFTKAWADRLRERGRTLDEHAGMSRFIAGMLAPEALLTMRMNTVFQGATRLATAGRSALATGAFSAGMAAAQEAGATDAVPASVRNDLLTSMVWSGMFGGVLGGAIGAGIGGRSSNTLMRDHMAAHRLYETQGDVFATFRAESDARRAAGAEPPAGGRTEPPPASGEAGTAPTPGPPDGPPGTGGGALAVVEEPPAPRVDVKATVDAINPHPLEVNDGVAWSVERPIRLGEAQVPEYVRDSEALNAAFTSELGEGLPPPGAPGGPPEPPPAGEPPEAPPAAPPPGGPTPPPGGPEPPPAAPTGRFVDPYRFAEGSGIQYVTWGGTPYLALVNNSFGGQVGSDLARLAHEMVQTNGIQLTGMKLGVAAPTSSVEATSFVRWGARYYTAEKLMAEQFYLHRGWDPASAGPLATRATEAKDTVMGLAGQPITRLDAAGNPVPALTYNEFERLVFQAAEDPSSTTDQNVLAAAAEWRRAVLDPMAMEGAATGVLLTPNHHVEASANIAMQRARAQQLDTQLQSLGLRPSSLIRRQVADWLDALDKRQTAADDIALETRRPYVPHVWNKRKVREERDALVQIVAEHWRTTSMQPLQTWAPDDIRAEIAVGNILGNDPGQQLERVIRAHLMSLGHGDNFATAQAATLSANVRQSIEAMSAKPLTREWNALTNQWTPGVGSYAFIQQEVRDALGAAGYPVPANAAASTSFDMLVQAIAPDAVVDLHDRGLPGHAHKRSIDAPISVIGEYLDLSTRNVMAEYIRTMGPAIETSRKFGDPSMSGTLIEQQIAMFMEYQASRGTLEDMAKTTQAMTDLRDKMIGRFSAPENASAWSVRTVRLLQSHAVMTQMGSSLITNLTDIARVTMEHGIAPMISLLHQLITDGDGWKLASHEARLSGAALEMVLLNQSKSIYDLQQAGADVSMIERIWHQGATNMMMLNGLVPFTQRLQEFTSIATSHFMMESAMRMVAGTATAQEIERMLFYGIDATTADLMVTNYTAAGSNVRPGGLRLMNTDAWMDRQLVDRVNAALKTAVDQQVVRSTAADRPNFMGAPLAQAIFMYKSFALAATQKTLLAGLQRRDMMVLQGVLASVGIAYLFAGDSDAKDSDNLINRKRLAQAIERSGMLGILSDVNNYVETLSGNKLGVRPALDIPGPYRDRSGYGVLAQTLGPAVSPWMRAARAWTDPSMRNSEVAGSTRRLIPFTGLFYLGDITRPFVREAVDIFRENPAR